MHGPWFLVQRRTITKYWTVSSATPAVDVSRKFMKLLLRIAPGPFLFRRSSGQYSVRKG